MEVEVVQVDVQLGGPNDVNEAVVVYERSNLARRHGHWPSRASRVAEVTAQIHDAASWFLIGRLGGEAVAMALVEPFRAHDGTGDRVSGTVFLNLIYVLPEQWGKGIGRTMLDAVIHEAATESICGLTSLRTNELKDFTGAAVLSGQALPARMPQMSL